MDAAWDVLVGLWSIWTIYFRKNDTDQKHPIYILTGQEPLLGTPLHQQLQVGDVPRLVAGLVGDEPCGGSKTCLVIQTQAKATEPSWV